MASATVPDNGLSEVYSFNLGPLSIGGYSIAVTPTSDTGIVGTPVTSDVFIGGAPLPPGTPIYVSGTCANFTISFAASATAGATYRIYLPQEIGGPTFIESPFATHIAGSGTLTQALVGAFVAGTAGDITVFVTSYLGGYESAYQKVIILFLANGTVPTNAPNIPTLTFATPPVDSGRNIEVNYIYLSAGQLAAPSTLQTRIMDENSTITNQSAASIGTAGTVITGSRTVPSGADGWFQVSARAITAGAINSDWSPWIGPVYCSNAVVDAPTDLVLSVVG